MSGEGTSDRLYRLSAIETLKALSNPQEVKLAELVSHLESVGLWEPFSTITLGDLRDAFSKPDAGEAEAKPRRKRRLFREAIAGSDEAEAGESETEIELRKRPDNGGLSTEEVARMVIPLVEGNGEVSLDDIAEYTRLDRKVLRHHLGVLCKEGRLERIGVGRHAIYSSVA